MSKNECLEIIQTGLWRSNPAFVQLLGMCPLLAMSTTLLNGMSLGLATALVMGLSNALVSMLRRWIPYDVRIPVFILLVAGLVTVVDLLWNAYLHDLYLVVGIFVPLIVTNCIVLARVEAFAAKNAALPALLDGVMMGLGATIGLSVLGLIRELLSTGAIFNGLDLVLGATWQPLPIFSSHYPGFLVAALPPGAFIVLGCLIAAKNAMERQQVKKRGVQQQSLAVSTDVVAI